ncbi:MAG: SDR family oxidoreductase [Alphaproteobacteria bacterium]|nr:SDR family oxidoreductase [Alphaproteobacteria bacterium]
MQSVFVSGANRGIGLEHVKRFAAAGRHVYAAVRDPLAADALTPLAESGQVNLIAYDAEDLGAPDRIAAALQDKPLDLVFNNAGIYGGEKQSLAGIDPEAFMTTIRVDALAPLLLTQALLPNLRRGARKIIANQSSRMGSIADNGSGGFYAYRAAKAGLNMITKSLALDLGHEGFIVVALHPGWVKTRMGGPRAPVDVGDSAAGQAALLQRLTKTDSGRFFDYTGAELPW